MTMTERTAAPMIELREQLERRSEEFANALPSHIKPAHFQRAALTAINVNPKLLTVDRRSLFNALMRCAQDGLIPDGRQAVLVIYTTKKGPIAQYQQMVAGVRALVQRSGEISRFEQTIVYENDKFEYRLGDHPEILHKPALTDRGKPILAYSIAQYRDGTLSREVMDTNEIEKVRRISRARDEGPWVDWWDEMARKTIAKRHAKVLPMSADAAEALARDDAEHFQPLALPRSSDHRPRLADRLENLGPTQPGETEPPRRRGRDHGKPENEWDEVLKDDNPEGAGRMHDGTPDAALDDAISAAPPDDTPPPTADFLAGVKDAKAGRSGCLSRDIKDDPARLRDWQNGFNSVKPHHDTPSV